MVPFKVKDGNVTYTFEGDKMEDLYEFDDQEKKKSTNYSVDFSSLDPNKTYCAVAWLNTKSGYHYSYDLVDCEGKTEAYRICLREPKNCPDSDEVSESNDENS